MPKTTYDHNYSMLYPNTQISAEVMAVLKQSDRKIKYQEYDRKSEKWEIDQEAQTAVCIPSREDSFERLADEDKQFASDGESVEDAVIKSILLDKLRLCLDSLDEDERALIDALFYDELTIREYAALIGTSRSSIVRRKQKILSMLKNFLEN